MFQFSIHPSLTMLTCILAGESVSRWELMKYCSIMLNSGHCWCVQMCLSQQCVDVSSLGGPSCSSDCGINGV